MRVVVLGLLIVCLGLVLGAPVPDQVVPETGTQSAEAPTPQSEAPATAPAAEPEAQPEQSNTAGEAAATATEAAKEEKPAETEPAAEPIAEPAQEAAKPAEAEPAAAPAEPVAPEQKAPEAAEAANEGAKPAETEQATEAAKGEEKPVKEEEKPAEAKPAEGATEPAGESGEEVSASLEETANIQKRAELESQFLPSTHHRTAVRQEQPPAEKKESKLFNLIPMGWFDPVRNYVGEFHRLNAENLYVANSVQDTLASSMSYDASSPYMPVGAISARHQSAASTPSAMLRRGGGSFRRLFETSSPKFNILKLGKPAVPGNVEDYLDAARENPARFPDVAAMRYMLGDRGGKNKDGEDVIDNEGFILPAEELSTATSSFSSTTSDVSSQYLDATNAGGPNLPQFPDFAYFSKNPPTPSDGDTKH